jgi:hypothetical protein
MYEGFALLAGFTYQSSRTYVQYELAALVSVPDIDKTEIMRHGINWRNHLVSFWLKTLELRLHWTISNMPSGSDSFFVG